MDPIYTVTLTFTEQDKKTSTKLSVTDKTYTKIIQQRKSEIANRYNILESDIEESRELL